MSEYQLELKQIVDYPRCRIYRHFVNMLLQDKNIRVGGSSGLFYFTILSSYANFRTSYKRVDGISYTIYPGEWICTINELSEWFRTRFHHQAMSILKLMALRMRRKGIQVFIIAPLKGHEFLRACRNTGGEFIQISPASKNCINVMEIRKTDKTVDEGIPRVACLGCRQHYSSVSNSRCNRLIRAHR